MGLRMDLEKIKVIWEWEVLKTKKKVYAFLGFANYYRAFIDKFIITVALFMVFAGKYLFFWTPEA